MNAASKSVVRQVTEVNHSDGQAIGEEHLRATASLLGDAIESEEFQAFAVGTMYSVARDVERYAVKFVANLMRIGYQAAKDETGNGISLMKAGEPAMKINGDGLLPASALTPEFLTAFVESQGLDHSHCTLEYCTHKNKPISQSVKNLNHAVNNSERFQGLVQKFIDESMHHYRAEGPVAFADLAVFFTHIGWDMASNWLEAQAL